jgi:hypothetical protein
MLATDLFVGLNYLTLSESAYLKDVKFATNSSRKPLQSLSESGFGAINSLYLGLFLISFVLT